MDAYTCPHCDQRFTSWVESLDRLIVCPHCNGMVSLPDEHLEAGAVLGGFEIVRLLGKGGMGHVYLARQASMNRMVALKVLSQDLTRDRKAVEQFFREMQLSGKLSHPNIVSAIDAGESDGLYYLAMNYVDGEDLEEELRRFGAIREDDGLRIAGRMTDALGYAWKHHGLLHKDIKPGNIMRDRTGEVYLMDMGIAQLVNEKSRRDELVVGSPFYMSPEQGRGDKLDWRSDCYSLGATLYHLMVGVPPFDNEDVVRIIAMHNTDPFPEPAIRRPGTRLRPETVVLLKRMMGKETDDRFVSWEEATAAIDKAGKVVAKKFSPPPRQAAAMKAAENARRYAPKPKKGKADGSGATVAKRQSESTTAKQSVDNRMLLVSYALMILVGVVVAVMIVRHRQHRALESAMTQAEMFLETNPTQLDEAVKRFSEVVRRVAGTRLAPEAERRLREVQNDAAAYREELGHFEREMERARQLCIAKQYEAAIPVVQAVREIRDPLKQKEADAFLVMINMTIRDRDAKK